MNNQQILERAIQKAIEGGWQPSKPVYGGNYAGVRYLLTTQEPMEIYRFFDPREYEAIAIEALIFNRDFAKSLWERDDAEWCTCNGWEPGTWPAWEWHLMQMVIADDPIKYLGENT